MPWLSYFDRFIPGTSTLERIRNLLFHDVVELRGTFVGGDGTPLKSERVSIAGGQLQLPKIAYQASALQKYPDNGGGVLPTQTGGAANGNALLKLPATVLQSQAAGLDSTGLLVVVTSGNALGEVRRIETKATSAGSQIVSVNANWASPRVPAAGDTIELLVDCRELNTIMVMGECSSSTNAPTVRFIGWPITLSLATTPVAILPPRVRDSAQTLVNTGEALDAIEGGAYCPTEPWTMESRGFLGFQVYLKAISAGNCSLFAGAR